MKNEKLLDNRNPSIAGIIAGICKGDLWLNDNKNPTLAVTYSYCVGGCGIAGEIDNGREYEVNEFLERVFEDLLLQGNDYFEFSSEDPKMCKQILSLFSGKVIESEEEYSYRRENAFDELQAITDEYVFDEVKGSLLDDIIANKFNNSEMFMERFTNSWEGKEKFLKYSKAFVAIKADRIVGVILGSARYENIITIDIEVEKEDRKQGIGTRLTQIMVNECVKEDIIVQWDHVESNMASARLAKKCGFVLFKKRPYYWFKIR